MTSALSDLAGLLDEAGANMTISARQAVRSIAYDLSYHVAMISLALDINGSRDGSAVQILSPWLKLLQFVAARPKLAPNLRRYLRARRSKEIIDMESWALMPRGYVGDQTHDRVIDLLVAYGCLQRREDMLVSSSNYRYLRNIVDELRANSLFIKESLVMQALRDVTPQRVWLGGE